MKLKIEKGTLLSALKNVARAVSPKSPIPVLTGIKFTASEGELVLTASDLEISINCTVQAEVKEPGSIVLPASTVVNLVDRIPAGVIIMETNKNCGVTIKYGKSKGEINGFSADEFPEPESSDTEIKFSISGDFLCNTMSRVVYAASDDTAKGVYCNINLEIGRNELVMASTDTYRLAIGKVDLEGMEKEKTVLLPKRAVGEIIKLFKTSESVAVKVSENNITLASDGIVMMARLQAGKFPAYKAVLPREFTTKIRVKSLDIIGALERALVLLKETVVTLDIKEDLVEVVGDSVSGRACDKVEALVTGNEIKVNFNINYLIEAIKNATAGDGEVWIGINGPLSPAMLRPVTKREFLNIILPVRIHNEVQNTPEEVQKAS